MLDKKDEDTTPIEKTHEPMMRLITFHIANEIYGVEVCNVREILLINQNFPVPGAPDHVLGITNIRGNVVTIIDARKRFDLPEIDFSNPIYKESARMIVVEAGNETAAVLVDSVSDVIDVEKSAVDLSPKIKLNNDSRFISGVVSHSDGLVIILNVDKFLSDDELDMVAGF
ncbi:MAG TPA: purine-binding chemotaxis protein CheW [Gammaproteobacteria bacterium]|nr:purine-binding chemotaxis protein CheW [Gammaproteobacteria bacterium]